MIVLLAFVIVVCSGSCHCLPPVIFPYSYSTSPGPRDPRGLPMQCRYTDLDISLAYIYSTNTARRLSHTPPNLPEACPNFCRTSQSTCQKKQWPSQNPKPRRRGAAHHLRRRPSSSRRPPRRRHHHHHNLSCGRPASFSARPPVLTSFCVLSTASSSSPLKRPATSSSRQGASLRLGS